MGTADFIVTATIGLLSFDHIRAKIWFQLMNAAFTCQTSEPSVFMNSGDTIETSPSQESTFPYANVKANYSIISLEFILQNYAN